MVTDVCVQHGGRSGGGQACCFELSSLRKKLPKVKVKVAHTCILTVPLLVCFFIHVAFFAERWVCTIGLQRNQC